MSESDTAIWMNPTNYRKFAVRWQGFMRTDNLDMGKNEKRIALGKRLGLDVDMPLDTTMLPDGSSAEVRDDLGLLLDPTLYAKKKCPQCHGRGILTTQRPVSNEDAEKMKAKPETAQWLHTEYRRANGVTKVRHVTQETARCPCAVLQYTKAVERFQKALLNEGLARKSVTKPGHIELT